MNISLSDILSPKEHQIWECIAAICISHHKCVAFVNWEMNCKNRYKMFVSIVQTVIKNFQHDYAKNFSVVSFEKEWGEEWKISVKTCGRVWKNARKIPGSAESSLLLCNYCVKIGIFLLTYNVFHLNGTSHFNKVICGLPSGTPSKPHLFPPTILSILPHSSRTLQSPAELRGSDKYVHNLYTLRYWELKWHSFYGSQNE